MDVGGSGGLHDDYGSVSLPRGAHRTANTAAPPGGKGRRALSRSSAIVSIWSAPSRWQPCRRGRDRYWPGVPASSGVTLGLRRDHEELTAWRSTWVVVR